jgi:Uma2 family endonuclease
MRLQRVGVPHYWIFDPEGRALIAYALEAGAYCSVFTAAGVAETRRRARIPPFEAVEIELGVLFGDEPDD